jgi:hypothetical protein
MRVGHRIAFASFRTRDSVPKCSAIVHGASLQKLTDDFFGYVPRPAFRGVEGYYPCRALYCPSSSAPPLSD